MDLLLPFKVGDAIETRSYGAGYRGAWFRGKLTDMRIREGHLECQVEYIDYPDEKRRWSRLYKVPPKCRNQKAGQNREIMLRPRFPQWCWENDILEHWPQTDIVAVVSSPWNVGDLIDWWYNDCFWTGKIIEFLGEDKVMIICPEIPIGEGGCWAADTKDLRPVLDWSLLEGWSTPLSQVALEEFGVTMGSRSEAIKEKKDYVRPLHVERSADNIEKYKVANKATKQAVREALKRMKGGKAMDPDCISIE
ncbi:uncharacterized protein LOC119342784, partial [Triticum dicoccoides]|uniref:uncharacterized protein LOC119342784 n=1 Tax=Triticum dicoccoides TaxID=85692 RepID=UPI001890B289